MFKLDDNLLRELGLGALPAEEKNRMLAHIYETLEMRVGMKLAEQMTNEQLDEFERFIDQNDEAGALKWLETNFPNYKQVVADELEKLKSEIKASASQILAASLAARDGQAVNSGAPQPQVQPGYTNPAPQQAAPFQPSPQSSVPSSSSFTQPQPSQSPGPQTPQQPFAPYNPGQPPQYGTPSPGPSPTPQPPVAPSEGTSIGYQPPSPFSQPSQPSATDSSQGQPPAAAPPAMPPQSPPQAA